MKKRKEKEKISKEQFDKKTIKEKDEPKGAHAKKRKVKMKRDRKMNQKLKSQKE